jgi:RHS repeat-associated protein
MPQIGPVAPYRKGRWIAQVGASTHYYLPDALGSTMKLVDSAGTAVNTYEYDVYGSFRSGSVPQPNEYRFAGEETQAGIQYLRARYYDTSTGRFLSKDPAAPDYRAPQSLNRFPYVRNNPINFTDPTGLTHMGFYQNVGICIETFFDESGEEYCSAEEVHEVWIPGPEHV